jgi:PAS domain-containing protein
MFAVTLTMFPIYDSMTATGIDSETPILTHFATVLNDIKSVPSSAHQHQPSASSSSNQTASAISNPAIAVSSTNKTSTANASTSVSVQEGNTTSETNSNNNNGSFSDSYSNSHLSSNNFTDSSLTNTSGVESNDNEESVRQSTTFHHEKKRKDGYRHSAESGNHSSNTSPFDPEDKHHSKHSTQPTDADMAALQESMTHDPVSAGGATSSRPSTVEIQNRELFTSSKTPATLVSIANQQQQPAGQRASSRPPQPAAVAASRVAGSSTGSANVSSNDSKSYDADASMNSSESLPNSSSPSSEDGSSTANSMYDMGNNSSGSENVNSTTGSNALGGLTSVGGSSSGNNVNDTSSVTSSQLSTVSSLLPYSFVTGVNDRRSGCIRFDAKCEMSPESFYKAARTVRLSDLLRLMISCQNALLLCDRFGRILHCNKGFVGLFEYILSDMEGHTLHFLYRQPSDIVLFEQCRMLNMRGESTDVTLQGFRKSGSTVYCRVITVPIRGGYRSPDITHYCSYFFPLITTANPVASVAAVQQQEEDVNVRGGGLKEQSSSATANATATAAAAAGGYNASNPHYDLHGILQRINSASPLIISNIIQPGATASSSSAARRSSKHAAAETTVPDNTTSTSSGSGKSSDRVSSSSSYPNEQSTSTLTSTSSMSVQPLQSHAHSYPHLYQQPPQQQHGYSYPQLTAASLAQQRESSADHRPPNIVPSSPAVYSHHQQYYHHNHHNHNKQPHSLSAPPPPVAHDLYYLNPNPSYPAQAPAVSYPYNHQAQTHLMPYMTGPYSAQSSASSAPPTSSNLAAYARNANIYNFAGASGSIPISIPGSYERMQISQDNSPQSGSPSNNQGSSGLISVGGFIGGIVDSEQDHYHHSDHYHHCEDEEGSVMYSDSGDGEDEDEEGDGSDDNFDDTADHASNDRL